jgi:RND family efflux transporter MFP subunit
LVASTYPRVIAQSERYEIVGILKNDRLRIYIDRPDSNEPVTGIILAVAIGGGDPINAEPADDGTYTLPVTRTVDAESVDVIFTIAADGGDDLLVGTINLPQGTTAATTAIGQRTWLRWITAIPPPFQSALLLSFAIFGLGVLFEQSRRKRLVARSLITGAAAFAILALLLAVTLVEKEGRSSNAAQVPPAAMSDAPRRLTDSTAFIAKPTQRLLDIRTAAAKPETSRSAISLMGRVIGDPNRTGIIQSIHGGRVIAMESGLPRMGQAVRKGDALLQIDPYLPLADRTTISEKSGEIEQLIAVAETRIGRLRPLAERGAVPQSQVIDLEKELEGLRLRQKAIRDSRTEPELLRAPTDGVITAVKVIPGQVVQPQDVLVQIVDPKALWVEALSFGNLDPASLTDATAVTTSGEVIPLSYRGFSRALQQHASVVHFALTDTAVNLNTGQPVTVVAKSGAPVSGIVIPLEAVVRGSNGEATVWLHVEPERFEPRHVRTRPLDATRVIVSAGLTAGERVVLRGADLINQVR